MTRTRTMTIGKGSRKTTTTTTKTSMPPSVQEVPNFDETEVEDDMPAGTSRTIRYQNDNTDYITLVDPKPHELEQIGTDG